MGYLFILLTAFFNVTKGGCSKVVSSKMDCVAESINVCFVRNVFCVIIGFFILLFSGASFSMPLEGWLICTFSGIFMAVNYIVWLLALKTGAYMLSNTASTSSFVAVALCGVVLFGETISVPQIISFVLVIEAVYFMLSYQMHQFSKPTAKQVLLLITVFVTAAGNSVVQKLFTTYVKDISLNHFTFYTFAISLLVLAPWRLFVKSPKKVREQTVQVVKLMPFILYMGATLYGATFFQAAATNYLTTVVIYPLSSALSLTGASILAWLCFKEKPTKDSIIGGVLVLQALILSKY